MPDSQDKLINTLVATIEKLSSRLAALEKEPPEEQRIERVAMRLAVKMSNPEKGDKGDKGDQGEKGEKGDRGEQGIPGKNGRDGVDGLDGKDGNDGKDGKDGENGRDGIVDMTIVEDLKKEIESLKRRISNMTPGVRERLLGGVLNVGVRFETPNGDIDAVNTTFYAMKSPKYIVVDGVTYFEGFGYSISGTGGKTITTNVPPAQFIRSAY